MLKASEDSYQTELTLNSTESAVGMNIFVYTECVSNTWKNFRSVFPTLKQGKKFVTIYDRNTLRGTDQQRVEMNPLDFYLWGHLKALVYSGPIENEGTLLQRNLMSVKPFATAPALTKGTTIHYQKCRCVHLIRQGTL